MVACFQVPEMEANTRGGAQNSALIVKVWCARNFFKTLGMQDGLHLGF